MNRNVIILMSLISQSAFASLTFSSPAVNSELQKSSVLTGSCDGKKDVALKGPGIASGKKISCQQKSSGNYWKYEIKNIYKDMPKGNIDIEISQGSNKVVRRFVKNSGTSTTPPPAATPTPTPTPAVTCNFGSKILSLGQSVAAYLEQNVAVGQQCTSPVMRTCTANGLSGSSQYQYESCTVAVDQTPVGDLDPNKAPAANFDLSLWKITLPVNSSGTLGGSAVEVKSIASTFEKEPYFYTAADGAMVFMAPTNGARTSGSKYPRSELREMTASGALAAWTASQGGFLAATLSVNELPVASNGAKGRVVIGQIHGPDDELCRLYFDDGKLYFYDDKAGSSQQETQFILKSTSGATPNISLNDKFSYSIEVKNNVLTVRAEHNGIEYFAADPLSSFWPGKALYFKAGAYVQVSEPGSGAGTVGSGKGQVSFYTLSKPQH